MTVKLVDTKRVQIMNNLSIADWIPIYPITGLPFVQCSSGHWALWNLILSIAGVLLVLIISSGFLAKKSNIDIKEIKEKENSRRCRDLMLIAAPVLTVLAMFLFNLTEDMTQMMVLTDLWTPVHAILFGAVTLAYIFLIKKDKGDDKGEEKIYRKWWRINK